MVITGNNYELLTTAMLECGSLVIPDMLLKFYTRLGLTELEMMVLIHLFHWRQVEQERFPTPEKLRQYMSLDEEEIKNLVASLIEKKFLAVEPYYNHVLGRWQNTFSFAPLWTKLTRIALGDYTPPAEPQAEGAATANKQGELYRTFEKEFGRPLSPLESDQLREWCQNEHLSVELLQEALRRAVLRGALNFRYIDSILRDWLRHNIRSVSQAMAHDEQKNKRKPRRAKPENQPPTRDKYRDLYRLNLEG
ncbi:DnaD domain-containing protein [Moorella sp. Hama-1]|uniref:DnaD domain-containing protein n=1 Tax=Moorella sp. Hama-1 TaxID=2138101 RepID=UPI000D65641F|nr:DnaD domain protein [Moorella sp. Hama-1]MDN5361288.1 replication protein [Moorella sp. (in: firmicutes)]BCV21264.1 DNA replication protein DnaD [Moorella sp. Hama-1]